MLCALALLKACPLETWRFLLERLSQGSPDSFEPEDKLQLYQAYMLLDSATDACVHSLPLPSVQPDGSLLKRLRPAGHISLHEADAAQSAAVIEFSPYNVDWRTIMWQCGNR